MAESELSETVQLRITCVVCEPRRGGPMCKYEREVPKYLVSGIIIGFHSSHEGHQLEVTVDDTTFLP